MTTPAPAPGWHPDPHGAASLRYHDGVQWTDHTTEPALMPPPVPHAPPVPLVVTNVAVATGGGGVNHGLHLVLTLLTCGMWAPIWLLLAMFGGRGGGARATYR